MPAQLNRVTVTGNLTRDPELRTLGNGDPVCSMRVAVSSRRRNGEQWEDYANFFNVTVFGRQAQTCVDYLGKGREVTVDGRLSWREYEKDGVRREVVEVIANDVFFGRGGDGERQQGGPVENYRPDLPVDAPVTPPTAPEPKPDDDDFPF